MGSLAEGGGYSPTSHHLNILEEVLGESTASNSMVRSYTRSFNGFAARLSDEEQQRIAGKKEVLSVFPSRKLQLQTTRSWDFVGLTETAKRNPIVESNIIIGSIDSGIWPESESFSDKSYGPPPKKWKGTCAGGTNFTCNNKLIGARAYGSTSARDEEGHGTHTASTAAGNKVPDVNFYGLAKGIARGGVPSARIAAYKVCSEEGCYDQDILAAFDDAIADGVDLITISIGGEPRAFDSDSIAIGSFHAMEKGILTLQSAGNSGPGATTVSSVTPWLFSIAASSIDRKFISKVSLANGKTLVGNAVNSFTLNGTKFPLVYGKDASSSCSEEEARFCLENCLDSDLVKGKIVVCNEATGRKEAFRAGALGVITLIGEERADVSFVVPLPSSALTAKNYDLVKSFINSTKNSQGSILKSEVIEHTTAPIVASFSSRGPNYIAADILKPDITAPGIDIIAAYSPHASPSGAPGDKRSLKHNVMSGTSMSCPHAAGAAAYLKTFHPDWSPSAIKSALMTTAWPMNATNVYEEGEFAFGAGHINPVKAIEPGLVYETLKEDYIKMLCSIKISFFGTCPKGVKGSPKDLNYPSMQALVESDNSFTVEFPRTVTNVGPAGSTYKAKVNTDSHINVSVKPSTLSFKSSGEKKSFFVTVSGKGLPIKTRVSASIVWSDGIHNVRSPIVVYTES
ncbi:subtilisin-like protease SBT4.13 [Quercus robur]|uniref:subtilisin-like protease SBT4.13 n=1 Tax=Quercus robur TaxID=38942 RepID=UPI0021610EEA|nr:subtilisin-like protease SBT4.13 [Quercus robur]